MQSPLVAFRLADPIATSKWFEISKSIEPDNCSEKSFTASLISSGLFLFVILSIFSKKFQIQ